VAEAETRPRALAWLVLAAAVLLAYTVLRASAVAFTYDESLTLRLVERPVFEIVTLSKPIANNHVLNTLLIKLARALFGRGELVYRLPNLAAHALSLGLSVGLARRARGTAQALGAFAVLAASPYLLDYFSLARGYGLAVACELAACVSLLAFERDRSIEEAGAALLASTAAVCANFAFLGFHVALAGALFGLTWRSSRRHALVLAGCGLAVVLAAARPLWKLRQAGELYYGGHTSFVQDTLGSLASGFAYGATYGAVLAPALGALLVLVLVGAGLCRVPGFRLLVAILAAQVAIAVVLHAAGTPWPLGRTALPFVLPVLVLAARLLASAPSPVAGVAAAVLAGHLIACANLTSAIDWRYTTDIKTAMRQVETERAAAGADRVRLLVSWPFEESALFYVREWGLSRIDCEVAEAVSDPERFDFYYVLDEDQPFGFKADRAVITRPGRRIVGSFPQSGSTLLRSP